MPVTELASGKGKLNQTPSTVSLQNARLHIPLGLWLVESLVRVWRGAVAVSWKEDLARSSRR